MHLLHPTHAWLAKHANDLVCEDAIQDGVRLLHLPSGQYFDVSVQAAESLSLSQKTAELSKRSAEADYVFRGTLVQNGGGDIVLRVPATLVRGFYETTLLAGAELYPGSNGLCNRDVLVISAAEIGERNVDERGRQFVFRLGPMVTQRGEDPYNLVWGMSIFSPWLEQVRKSYGFSPRYRDKPFFLGFAARRVGVLNANTVSKHAEADTCAIDEGLEEDSRR